jgi:hypothetical protein
MIQPSEQTPVDVETAQLILRLRDKLRAQFGFDFSYVVMAKGHYVATSNAPQGITEPVIK